MSKMIATRAIRGAHSLAKKAEGMYNKALKEKGPECEIGFPNTAYYLPFAYAMLGLKVTKLSDLDVVLKEIKSLLPPVPSEDLWLPYLGPTLDAGMAALFSEEIIEVLKYLMGPNPVDGIWLGFTDDAILREQGIKLVDGRMPGFAACVGGLPTNEEAVKLARQLQERNILVFMAASSDGKSMAEQLAEEGVDMGWDNYLVPYGKDISSAIYALNFAARSAMTFGGITPKGLNEARKILLYNRERVYAFVLAFGEVDDEKFATAAGAINFGFPTIADTDIDKILPSGICKYEHVVSPVKRDEIIGKAVEVRGLKIKVTKLPIPVPYGAGFEGERVRKGEFHVQFGGRFSTAFEYVTSKDLDEIEDGKNTLVGLDIDKFEEASSQPLGIIVKVAGRKMQKDFESVLERQLHRYLNYAMGIFHMGQRDQNWLRISKEAYKSGFRLGHFSKVIHAMIHQEYGAIIDKVQVELYTGQDEVDKYLEAAKKVFDERDERMAGMTDESVDTFYSCTICVPEGGNVTLADGSFDRIENVIECVADEKDLDILSLEGNHLSPKPVGELFINPAPSKLIDIQLSSGNSLQLTGNHKVLVDTKIGLDWIESRKLKEGDCVISLHNCNGSLSNGSESSGPIYLIDLLSDDAKVFDGEFLERLKKAILSKYGSIAMASKEFGISYQRLYSSLYKSNEKVTSYSLGHHRLLISEIKSILAKLDMKWGKVKDNIQELGTTRSIAVRKKFLDEELMYAFGLIASDGYVKARSNSYVVEFSNTNRNLVKSFCDIQYSFWGEKPVTYTYAPKAASSKGLNINSKKPCYATYVNNPLIGRILVNLGIGNNGDTKWRGDRISKLPSNLIAAFIRGLFDGDGHVTNQHILITNRNKKEATDLHLLLKRLGIATYITEIKRGYQVGTRSAKDFIRFRKIISSGHPDKKKKMNDASFLFDDKHVIRTNRVPLSTGIALKQLIDKYGYLFKVKRLPIDYKTLESWIDGKRRPSREKLSSLLDELRFKPIANDPLFKELQAWAGSNLTVEKIKKISTVEYSGKSVYNFSVKDTHNYLVNGVVVKNCQSYAPNHVCIISPERLGLCGAYNWLDGKAASEINPAGANQPVKKGEVIDEKKGQWKGVNDFVFAKSNQGLSQFSAYSLVDSPMTSCAVKDTEVILDNKVIKIGDFVDEKHGTENYVNTKALTLNNGKAISEKLVAIQKFPIRSGYKLVTIRTKSGSEIQLTPNHQLAIDRPEGLKWTEASKLKAGDRIIALKRLEIEEKKVMLGDIVPKHLKRSLPKAKDLNGIFCLLGLIASDGSITKRGPFEYRVHFVNTDSNLIDRYSKLHRTIFPDVKLGFRVKKPYTKARIRGRRVYSIKKCHDRYSNNTVLALIATHFGIKIGRTGDWGLSKLLDLPKDYVKSFLCGIFDGDGSVRLRCDKKKWPVAEAYICIDDKKAAYHLQLLLKGFSILSNVKKSNSIYKVMMYGDNVYKFSNLIKPAHTRKSKIIREIKTAYKDKRLDKTQLQVLPFFVGKKLVELPRAKSMLSETTRFYYKTARSRHIIDNVNKVLSLSSPAEKKEFKNFINADYYLDIVTDVKMRKTDEKFVYNLTLADTHCYFANQLLIKNCGCFECILALIPEANGVMVVNREYGRLTPCGMKFTSLAGMVGGGNQTPGFLGIGRLYITSKKFISADGGIKRLLWLPKELKEDIKDRLMKRLEEIGMPELYDKIGDETVATDAESLLKFLKEKKHPALEMEPLI